MAAINNSAKKYSYAQARGARGFNKIEIGYALIIVRGMGGDERLRVYRKLASLLRNRFSLMDALERQYAIVTENGKKTGEPWAIAIAMWITKLRNGATFSDAIKGWAPASERLMLSVGDVSRLEMALLNLIKVTEGIQRMKGPIISALSYPCFLLFLTILIIWGTGVYMVPPMLEVAPDVKWTGAAKSLVWLAGFVNDHWLMMVLFFPILFLIIFWTFGSWRGQTRAFVEDIPPYSIYRIFIGVGWLLSLSSLVKAGTPVSKALRSLRSDASPYLMYRIDKTLIYIGNGDNLGDSLYKTKLLFPDKEIIGDLRIYSELDNFQESLEQVAYDWLESSIEDVANKAAVLNTAAILAVAAVIAWVVFGTFEMQNQMMAAGGIT